MNVFILATVCKPELLEYTTLVFKTLRVGFPTAKVHVSLNPMGCESECAIRRCCDVVGATHSGVHTIHHEWIVDLLNIQHEPFYILDTDLIFYRSFEQFQFTDPLAGWRIPEFSDYFSGCITRARLHTSLLYFNPEKVRAAFCQYKDQVNWTKFVTEPNLINPTAIPYKGRPYFYDCCSMLYHAIGGQAFTDAQKDCYLHMNFGTIPDLVLPRLPAAEVAEQTKTRAAILRDPELGRGQWRNQEAYYREHPV